LSLYDGGNPSHYGTWGNLGCLHDQSGKSANRHWPSPLQVVSKQMEALIELFYNIHHNFFFSPHTLTSLLKRSEFEVADVQFGAANVHRWRIVPSVQ
jgi:hypothetical protein